MSGSQLGLLQADGQNSPAYIVYSKIWRRCNGVVGLFTKKGEFHHFTVMVRVSSLRAMVSISVTIRVRFSFSNRVGIGLSDVQ